MLQTMGTGDFAVDRQRHVRAFAALAPAETEKCTWPLEKLHALRDQRLRAVVRMAKERSPWHARRLRHVDAETLSGDDLSAIPPMTKADLMANWDEIVTDRRLNLDLANAHLRRVATAGPSYLLDDYLIVASAEFAGVRGVFAYDFEAALQVPLGLRRHEQWLVEHGVVPECRRSAVVGAGRRTHASVTFGATFAGMSVATRSFPIASPLPEIVAGLNDCQPERLGAYPSVLYRLAFEAQAGRLRIVPLLLSTSGEALLPEARRMIEDTFRAPNMNQYSSSEHLSMAISYPGSGDLHLVEDQAVYEPVDHQRKSVSAGTPAAAVLITNVVNKLLPLIRYELTDEVTLVDTPNPVPWTGRRIAPVPGRFDNDFEYRGGVEVPPNVSRSTLGRLPTGYGYQG
jgi:phenylacetate-coenzyme A ligase PaaK-like adenylate-forming protein